MSISIVICSSNTPAEIGRPYAANAPAAVIRVAHATPTIAPGPHLQRQAAVQPPYRVPKPACVRVIQRSVSYGWSKLKQGLSGGRGRATGADRRARAALLRALDEELGHGEVQHDVPGDPWNPRPWLGATRLPRPGDVETIDSTLKVLDAHRVESVARPLLACLSSPSPERAVPAASVPLKGRQPRFTEALGPPTGAVPPSPPRLLDPAAERALVNRFVDNMPRSAMQASHQLCRQLAEGVGRMPAKQFAALRDDFAQAGASLDAALTELRRRPRSGMDCVRAQLLASAILMRALPGRFEWGPGGAIEGIICLLAKTPAPTDLPLLQGALVGTIMAFKYWELNPGAAKDVPKATIDYEALRRSVEDEDIRSAMVLPEAEIWSWEEVQPALRYMQMHGLF